MKKKELLSNIAKNYNDNKDFLNKEIINFIDDEGCNLLHYAIVESKLELVKKLIASSIDINKSNVFGVTPLELAINYREKSIVKLLMKENVELFDRDGFNVFHSIAVSGDVEIFNFFLKSNIDVNLRDNYGRTPLHWAVQENNINIVKEFLKLDIDVNITDSDEFTPLLLAASECNEEIVKLLIDKNADIKYTTSYGENAEKIAKAWKCKEVVILLNSN